MKKAVTVSLQRLSGTSPPSRHIWKQITVRCCIRLSLTFLLPPAPPIRTLDIRRRLHV